MTRHTPRRPGLDDKRYWTNRARLKTIGDHICIHCRFPIDLQRKWPDPLSWSCDHVVPRSTLPPNDPRHWHLDYLREAHLRCNESRGNTPLPSTTPPPDTQPSIDW